MSHFADEIDDLRGRLLKMGGLVESAIHRSVEAVVEREEEYAQQVLQDEARINQMEMEIDDFATKLLATQQPVAADLRFLTAAIKINNDLERMGDLAVNIVERAISLMRMPPVRPLTDIPLMARRVETMVRNALDAFVRKDEELARTVLVSDDAVDEQRDQFYTELVNFMQKNSESIPQALDLVFVTRNLERIGDHSTNIAEDVVFMIKGIDVRHHAEARV